MKPAPFQLFTLVLTLAASLPAFAESFTVEAAVRHALSNNADLAAARLGVDEARGRLAQSGLRPNPTLDGEFKPNVRGREGSLSLGFTQKFPLASRLHLEKAVSRGHLAVAESEVREAERRLSLEVRSAAIHLAALDALGALRELQTRNGRELAAASATSAAIGEASSLDSAQFELETSQLALHRVQTESARDELASQLRLLLGLPPEGPLGIAEPLTTTHTPAASIGNLEQRPDLIAAKARHEAANQAVELARVGRWEDVSVGLFGEVARTRDEPLGIETEGLIGLRVSLPLPLWNKNSGRIAEASATALRAEKETDALARRIRSETAVALAQMQAATALAKALGDDLLPKARLIEERLQRLHAGGQSPVSDLLRARERRLQLEASLIEARRDFHLARARHLAATGTILSPAP